MNWKLLWQIFWLFTKVAMVSWGQVNNTLLGQPKQIPSLYPGVHISRKLITNSNEFVALHCLL